VTRREPRRYHGPIDPAADVDTIDRHLDGFAAVCRGIPDRGPIAALDLRERYHWLVAPRSTVLQTSPAHAGRADDLPAALDRLFARLARPWPPITDR
jgi:Protein of unknown function (DUF3037)